MTQLTFAEAEYANKKHKTRRELFLEKMDKLIPWAKLEKKIAHYYPKGENGRPPYPLSTMLRVHSMQLFYNLSDPAMEDALYEIESMRQFAGLRLSERLPDETTILNFRHFLEQHKLGNKIFDTINQHLSDQGLMLREDRKSVV
jgi:IS5 family transposase